MLRTLRTKLVTAGFSIQLLVLVLFLVGMHRVLRDSLADNFTASARQTAETLNLAMAPDLTQGRQMEIQEFFEEIMRDSTGQLRYVVVMGASGKVLIHAGAVPQGHLPAPSENAAEAVDVGMYHIRRPILLSGNEVGTLQFGLSTDLVTEIMRRVMLVAVGISVAVSLLALLLFMAGSRRVNLRLMGLINAHEALAAGNYAARGLETSKDELGRLNRHFNAMAEKIGEQVRSLEASRARFFGVFEGSPVAMVVTRPRGEDNLIVDANLAFERLFGYTREETLGRSARELNLYTDLSDRKALLQEALAKGQCERDVAMRDRNGNALICNLAVRMLTFDGAQHLVFVIQDITALKRYERELRDVNVTLEGRVTERTSELAEKNAHLAEALARLKKTQDYLVQTEKMTSLGMLVAGVAHELNTPIGNSRTVAGVLVEESDALKKSLETGIKRSTLEAYVENVHEAGELLDRNLRRAGELIDSFKEVAVDRSSSKRRTFDLKHIVDEIMTTLAPSLKRLPFVVEVDVLEGITCDSFPGPLGQVVMNLLDNAIKHGLDGRKQGTVRVSAILESEDNVVLRVSDDGWGIAPENLPRIFDPFFTTKLGHGGSGLGLNIVYNIAASLLGGSVSVISKQGEGTTFAVAFPRVAPAGGKNEAE